MDADPPDARSAEAAGVLVASADGAGRRFARCRSRRGSTFSIKNSSSATPRTRSVAHGYRHGSSRDTGATLDYAARSFGERTATFVGYKRIADMRSGTGRAPGDMGFRIRRPTHGQRLRSLTLDTLQRYPALNCCRQPPRGLPCPPVPTLPVSQISSTGGLASCRSDMSGCGRQAYPWRMGGNR